VGFFAVGFFRWVYPKKPTGFFGYALGCLNPDSWFFLDYISRVKYRVAVFNLVSFNFVALCFMLRPS